MMGSLEVSVSLASECSLYVTSSDAIVSISSSSGKSNL